MERNSFGLTCKRRDRLANKKRKQKEGKGKKRRRDCTSTWHLSPFSPSQTLALWLQVADDAPALNRPVCSRLDSWVDSGSGGANTEASVMEAKGCSELVGSQEFGASTFYGPYLGLGVT